MFLLIFLVDLSDVLQSGFIPFFRRLIWNISVLASQSILIDFALKKSCVCMRFQVCEIKGQALLVQRFLSGYKPNEVNSAALNINYCQHVLWELSPCTGSSFLSVSNPLANPLLCCSLSSLPVFLFSAFGELTVLLSAV